MKIVRNVLLIIVVSIIILLIVKFMFMDTKCECDCNNFIVDNEMTDDEKKEDKYLELINILTDYLEDIYNKDEWMNGGLETKSYTVTLEDLQKNGKDISMFVNPVTGEKCDLDKTYGRFIVLGELENGKTDYIYDVVLSCEGETPTE